jgi:hypothetical protein
MSRPLKLLSIIAGSAVAVVAVAVSASLWFPSTSSTDEVARVLSPEGAVEAVLMETNGGATTSFGYEVFIVPRGTKEPNNRAVHLHGAIRNSGAYGANLRWLSASELLVEFEEAKSSDVERPTVMVAGRTVRVTLRPGVTDSTAPPGGMLYNIRERV